MPVLERSEAQEFVDDQEIVDDFGERIDCIRSELDSFADEFSRLSLNGKPEWEPLRCLVDDAANALVDCEGVLEDVKA